LECCYIQHHIRLSRPICPNKLAGESACPTTAFACIGGTGFSLSTPACERIFSYLLTLGLRAEPRLAVAVLSAYFTAGEAGDQRQAG
jgi:hypothetical protein